MKQQIQRFTCAVLALALTLGLGLTALPASAADATQRGVVTYTEVIAPEYEEALSFSDGLAAVKKDGKWGFADTSGSVVIDFQYDDAYSFSDGIAPVQKDGKWGFIDRDNNVAVDFQYDVAYEFSEGKSVVGCYDDDGFYDEHLYMGFVTTAGVYTPFEDTYGNICIINLATANVPSEAKFTNGVITFTVSYGAPRILSAYDSNGAFICRINGAFNGDIGLANEGLIPFQEEVNGGTFVRGGWLDMDGNVVHQYEVEYFGPGETVEGYWGVETTQSYRYIAEVRPFDQGLAPAWQVVYDAETGVTTSAMGFIDRATFDWVIGPQYESYWYMSGDTYGPYAVFVNGLAMVQKDGKWGAIDKRGKTVIPFQYEGLYSINEGLIAFQLGGKWGYLSGSAPYEVVIPAQYERVTGFSNGLAAVYDGENAFLIDWYGNPVPGAGTLDPSVYFKEDGTVRNPDEYVTITRDGKYGIGHIEYLPELPKKTALSSWAYDEVVEAIEEDLVPVDLQNLYHNDITRIELSRVLVQTVEAALGQDIADVVLERTGKSLSAWQNEYPFTDTSSRDVIAAYALGIINGYGNGLFVPAGTATRQEVAVMLARTAKIVGVNTDGVDGAVFTDGDQVAGWAAESLSLVSHYGIMKGYGNGSFNPLGTFTREQSYLTALRLVQAAEQ